jgi:restriction system protein
MTRPKGPKFLRYALPVLDTLKALGGSGKPGEVTDAVIEALKIPEEEQQETNKNGNSRVKNQIAWARFYLAKGGFIDPSERGLWRLTRQGETTKPSYDDIYAMFRSVQGEMHRKNSEDGDADGIIDELEQETELLSVLRSLSAEGFERICQLLLRKSGFEKVEVTGRSGDGGIDGHGLLELNPFVSFKVLFQCKKYTDRPVSASHVRDFRGAMMGRADKGIILTTGQFTSDAQKEARRDGVPPIELVNGEKLVSMFEHLQLGVRPTTVFKIDNKFFDEYR